MNKIIDSKEIEIRIANATRPTAISNYNYPLNILDDRIFEILMYSIFNKRNENENSSFHEFCEDVILMQGVGERGMDCILRKNNLITAIIQCKKYAKNISPTQIIEEIAKFAIHFYLDAKTFQEASKFKYILATSTGYTGKSNLLIPKLKDKSFVSEYDFDKILVDTIKKYKGFQKIEFSKIKNDIINLISEFNYEFITPQKINIWLNDYPVLIDSFFEIKKVTDNNLITEKSKEIIAKIDSLHTKNDNDSIDIFIKKYTNVAKEKLDSINFIGFDLHKHRQKPTDITLTELYVEPNFKQRVSDKNTKVNSLSANDLKIANIFKSEKNLVILGEPGAGKSLLVKFLIIQILNKKASSSGLLKYESHIPFRITLRKYYEVKDKFSFVEYLSEVLSNLYQTPISKTQLEFLLTERKCIIFFDGLDEIFNIVHKNELKELIETFSLSHPNVKCVVTSRFIGYHDVKFKASKFDEFAIKKLDDPQIAELVTKFYTTQIKNVTNRNIAIENCMTQLQNDIDDELKSNPLILTLILILTSNNIVIPDSKLEIYESCTKTLVESIDSKEKELKFVIPVKSKRITFASLAYWQYESLSNGDEVSFDKTKRKLADFFLERKEVQEFVDAEEKAEKFLEYAERRSIYFEDNFTHKTFLEYYTSDYLYINYFTKASDNSRKELLKIISKYLPNPFWYIVFELLFLRIDNDQADNEVMDDFLLKQIASNSIDVFYFLISNISSYANVSEEVKENVIKKTILSCIKGEKISQRTKKIRFEENSIVAKINSLTQKGNFIHIIQKVIFEIEQELTDENKLIDFYNFYYELISFVTDDKKVQIKDIDRVERLSLTNQYLFSYYNFKDGLKNFKTDILIKQIEYFGIKSIYKDLNFKFRENTARINTFDIFLINLFENQDASIFETTYTTLQTFGVKESEILEHIKETKVYYFHRDKGFKNLLNMFVGSNSSTLDRIIITLIETMPDKREDYLKYRMDQPHKKLKSIDDIYNKTSR